METLRGPHKEMKENKLFIRAGFKYPGESWKLFSLLTLKKYMKWL